MFSAISKHHPWVLLIGRSDLAQFFEDSGEEVKQGFQPCHVGDDPEDLEVQLIDVFGKFRTEPTLAVLDRQPDFGWDLG